MADEIVSKALQNGATEEERWAVMDLSLEDGVHLYELFIAV